MTGLNEIIPYDVVVIGGGPAGLAAAAEADRAGAKTLLVEREGRLGGILKQCVHDGFGLVRFGEKLSGPEYAHRFITALVKTTVHIRTQCFVSTISPVNPVRTVSPVREVNQVSPIGTVNRLNEASTQPGFQLTLVGRDGIETVQTSSLVLATGCRERTARQIAIHGTRPAGIYTAGTAQHYVNLLGVMPTRRCVILGSGDIGLIMARRLTLEGAQVLGVYEARSACSGLTRNLVQCLHDFDIPLHLSHTVTRVFGHNRLEAVAVAQVDDKFQPIPGTEQRIDCDALILSVGLIPENELAETLGVPLDRATNGPICDQNNMTLVPGVFCCGNALHVNDLVDYVSENGETAGRAAARYALHLPLSLNPAHAPREVRQMVTLQAGPGFLYALPQRFDLSAGQGDAVVYFRSAEERGATRVRLLCDGHEVVTKTYRQLRPPEMERLTLPMAALTARIETPLPETAKSKTAKSKKAKSKTAKYKTALPKTTLPITNTQQNNSAEVSVRIEMEVVSP